MADIRSLAKQLMGFTQEELLAIKNGNIDTNKGPVSKTVIGGGTCLIDEGGGAYTRGGDGT